MQRQVTPYIHSQLAASCSCHILAHAFYSLGATPVIVAAEYGGKSIETLRLLINAKADLTARGNYMVTALGCAVKKNKSDVVAFLTSLGAPM